MLMNTGEPKIWYRLNENGQLFFKLGKGINSIFTIRWSRNSRKLNKRGQIKKVLSDYRLFVLFAYKTATNTETFKALCIPFKLYNEIRWKTKLIEETYRFDIYDKKIMVF